MTLVEEQSDHLDVMASDESSDEDVSNRIEVGVGDPQYNVVGTDFIIHNMYAGHGFTTFRKWFQDDPNAMLIRVASHVQQGLYKVISVHITKHSCVVICTTDKTLEDVPEGSFTG